MQHVFLGGLFGSALWGVRALIARCEHCCVQPGSTAAKSTAGMIALFAVLLLSDGTVSAQQATEQSAPPANQVVRHRMPLGVERHHVLRVFFHHHHGAEHVYLLDGDLWSDGVELSPGDYLRADANTDHGGLYSKRGCHALVVTAL